LRGCFDCTDWRLFYDSTSDQNELVVVISSYVTRCVDMLITVFPNNKPWVTKDLKDVLNKKKLAFFHGSADEKKQVNKEVKLAIRKAKGVYRSKIESKFMGGSLSA